MPGAAGGAALSTDFFAVLNAALLACDSATDVLERFFGGPISVRRLAGPVLMPDPGQRARLGLLAATAWRHRRVQLVREGAVLSEADLWFVPARLTPDMVVALEGTDIPFGRVVRPLGPKRTRIAGMGEALPPGVALVHRAIVATAPGPIAEVYERYPVTLADMPARRT